MSKNSDLCYNKINFIEEKFCNICLKQTKDLKFDVYKDEVLSQIPILQNLELNTLCMWCESTLKKITKFLNLVLESQKILNNYEGNELKTNRRPNLSIYINESVDIPAFNEVYIPDVDSNGFYSENTNEMKIDLNLKKYGNIKRANQLQFSLHYLSLEKQKEEIEMKKKLPQYLERDYKCTKCGLGFVSDDVFAEHVMKHSDSSGDNVCEICTLRFKSKQVLSQHNLLHSRIFICNICGIGIKKWSHAVTHRYKCGDVSVAVCLYCKKVFGNKHSLAVHIRGVHKIKKKYVCNECKLHFGTRQRLRVHTRSHTGLKPFKCECGRKFTTNSNLKSHQKVHSISKEHYCVECNTYYKTHSGLKKHLNESLKHGEERRIPCPQCDKKFHSEAKLNSHLRLRHLTQYTCDECNKNFSSNSNLRKHIRCVHKTDMQ